MELSQKIESLIKEINSFEAANANEVEEFRIKISGKKGILNDFFEDFKNVDPSLKKEMGIKLNEVKSVATEKINSLKEKFTEQISNTNPFGDLTRPSAYYSLGSRHPLSLVRTEIIQIFEKIGFNLSEGPEIEDDWHNFTALNFPPEHPARDMQDTFFIEGEGELALRTHTSSVQVRLMENQKPPLRSLMPGRVYRNEAISARAHCQFHQVEGLYVDKDVSFGDLKQTLLYFAKEMFGEKTEIRLRPSYFPFTEPSAEMDITCSLCSGKGCNVCKHSGWVEIMGCGMIDPAVLTNCGIDTNIYNGFAFGMGIERIAMLKYQIKDLRLFFENDVRFLSQFKSAT